MVAPCGSALRHGPRGAGGCGRRDALRLRGRDVHGLPAQHGRHGAQQRGAPRGLYTASGRSAVSALAARWLAQMLCCWSAHAGAEGWQCGVCVWPWHACGSCVPAVCVHACQVEAWHGCLKVKQGSGARTAMRDWWFATWSATWTLRSALQAATGLSLPNLHCDIAHLLLAVRLLCSEGLRGAAPVLMEPLALKCW